MGKKRAFTWSCSWLWSVVSSLWCLLGWWSTRQCLYHLLRRFVVLPPLRLLPICRPPEFKLYSRRQPTNPHEAERMRSWGFLSLSSYYSPTFPFGGFVAFRANKTVTLWLKQYLCTIPLTSISDQRPAFTVEPEDPKGKQFFDIWEVKK